MVVHTHKKIIEYRFLFELSRDVNRFEREVEQQVNNYADVEIGIYRENIGYINLLIYNDIWVNNEEYLKVLIRAALSCRDCHYIEETINEVNNFIPERVYKNRCADCLNYKYLNCMC